MTDRRVPVTAIVLTLDEELNIAECLSRLVRLDEVVLVDSGSTDGTVARARSARPDVRVLHHPFKDFGDQRTWALENAGVRNAWVLFVDADEHCDDALLDEVAAFVDAPGGHVGAFVAGKNYFLGKWLRHATLYPSYQLRLVKVGSVGYVKHGHGQREVASGPLHYLEQGWRHETLSKGIAEWISRHNRYSTVEVELLLEMRAQPIAWSKLLFGERRERRRTLKHLSAKVPLRPLWTFLYLYVVKRGFLDGRPGLVYCLLMTTHHMHIAAKLAEHAYVTGRESRGERSQPSRDAATGLQAPIERTRP